MDDDTPDNSTPALWPKHVIDSIFDDVASGESVLSACSKPGRPNRRTLYRWLASYPELSIRYSDAVRKQIDSRYAKPRN